MVLIDKNLEEKCLELMEQAYIPTHEETFQGEQLAIDKTANDYVTGLEILGKSVQVQTEQGKNLLDSNYLYDVLEVAYPTPTDKGTLYNRPCIFTKMNSTGVILNRYTFKSGTQYIFRVSVSQTGTVDVNSWICTIQFYYTDATSSAFAFNATETGIKTGYITKIGVSTAGKTISYIKISAGGPDNIAIATDDLQLEEGSVATTYAPFVPNSPSPNYPSPISSSQNFNLLVTGQSPINYPITLRSLLSIANDKVDNDNSKIIRDVGVKVLNGTETGWGENNRLTSTTNFYLAETTRKINTAFISSHFVLTGNYLTDDNGLFVANNNKFYIRVKNSVLGIIDADTDIQRVTKLKSWLTAQYNAGTPVTVYYQLATPTEEAITKQTIPTTQLVTELSTNATVKPDIKATCKILGN